MSIALLDAFDLVIHSSQLQGRLEAAAAELSLRSGFTEEKAWLELAQQRLASAAAQIGDLPTRVLRLSDLDPIKGDQTRLLQGTVVDALERLHAGILFAGGPRSPLADALYWNGKVKLQALRRFDRDEFEKHCADFERRLRSSYAVRILKEPEYAVVEPALNAFQQSLSTWRGVVSSPALSETEAEALRCELSAMAKLACWPKPRSCR
jgi:hypothetical protein